jgi:hypothetical protein
MLQLGRTLEQALDLGKFARIVELSKVFCFLRQVLPLHGRIALVGHDFGRRIVEVGDERREVETWIALDESPNQSDNGAWRTPPL